MKLNDIKEKEIKKKKKKIALRQKKKIQSLLDLEECELKFFSRRKRITLVK